MKKGTLLIWVRIKVHNKGSRIKEVKGGWVGTFPSQKRDQKREKGGPF